MLSHLAQPVVAPQMATVTAPSAFTGVNLDCAHVRQPVLLKSFGQQKSSVAAAPLYMKQNVLIALVLASIACKYTAIVTDASTVIGASLTMMFV